MTGSEQSCTSHSAVNNNTEQQQPCLNVLPPGQHWPAGQLPTSKVLQPGSQPAPGTVVASGILGQQEASAQFMPQAHAPVPMLPGMSQTGLPGPMPGWGFPGMMMYPFQMQAMASMYPMGMFGMASFMYQQQQVMQQQMMMMQQQMMMPSQMPAMGMYPQPPVPFPTQQTGITGQTTAVPLTGTLPLPNVGSSAQLSGMPDMSVHIPAADVAAGLAQTLADQAMQPSQLPSEAAACSMHSLGMERSASMVLNPAGEKPAGHNNPLAANAPSASSSATTAGLPTSVGPALAPPPPPLPTPPTFPPSSSTMPAPPPPPLTRKPRSSTSKQQLKSEPQQQQTGPVEPAPGHSDDPDDQAMDVSPPERAAAFVLPPGTDPDTKVALPILIPGLPLPKMPAGTEGDSLSLSPPTHPVMFVSARRAAAIMRRREQRARLAAAGQLASGIRVRKPYMHQSRHDHAQRRIRGPGGRFLSAQEKAALLASGGGGDAGAKQEDTEGGGSDVEAAVGSPSSKQGGGGGGRPKAASPARQAFTIHRTASAGPSKGGNARKAAPSRMDSTVSAPAATAALHGSASTALLQDLDNDRDPDEEEVPAKEAARWRKMRQKRGASRSRPDSPPDLPGSAELDEEDRRQLLRAASDTLLAASVLEARTPSKSGAITVKLRPPQRSESGPPTRTWAGSGSNKKLPRTSSCLTGSPPPSSSASELGSSSVDKLSAAMNKFSSVPRLASSQPTMPSLMEAVRPLAPLGACDAAVLKDDAAEELSHDDPALAPLELSHIVDVAGGTGVHGPHDDAVGLQPLDLDFLQHGTQAPGCQAARANHGDEQEEEELLLMMAGDLMHDIWGPGQGLDSDVGAPTDAAAQVGAG